MVIFYINDCGKLVLLFTFPIAFFSVSHVFFMLFLFCSSIFLKYANFISFFNLLYMFKYILYLSLFCSVGFLCFFTNNFDLLRIDTSSPSVIHGSCFMYFLFALNLTFGNALLNSVLYMVIKALYASSGQFICDIDEKSFLLRASLK